MKKYILTLAITIVSLASLASFAHAQEYTFSRDLSAGVSGDDVTALQSWLISSGYDIPAISSNSAMKGYFGSQTRQALMKYQLSIGLPNTGYFGPLTRGRIHGSYRGNSLVVTSPNGGEVWKKGTVQNITWNSTIKQGVTEKFNYTADIKLSFPLPECAKPGANPVCAVKMRAPYTIAKGVSLSAGTYSWNVGSFIFDPVTVPYCSSVSTTGDCINPSPLVEDGQYIIQICPTNGSECDESNGEFTISSSQLLQVCPSEKIVNRMPVVYPNQNPPSTYYILNGVRRELTEFDQNWVLSHCTVAEQVVY
ncbi:MAG: peptidoglycan-binding protein [Candidatus Pacebacteria bacterium]|nr:peptidoglycan-binding protein [Candidatus Paceibacterota bacterium]